MNKLQPLDDIVNTQRSMATFPTTPYTTHPPKTAPPTSPQPITSSTMIETVPHDMYQHTEGVQPTTSTSIIDLVSDDFELLPTVLAQEHKTATNTGHIQTRDGQKLTNKSKLYKNHLRPIVEYFTPTPAKRKASGSATSSSKAATKRHKTIVATSPMAEATRDGITSDDEVGAP